MSTAFDSIRQGLEEAAAYAGNKKTGARTHYPRVPDVQAIRNKTGMNQNEFAAKLGVSVKTLKYWEKGEKKPRGPELVLLHLIDKKPKTLLDILSRQP
ncbi:MAG: helix-turn-helix domain-containing protein [Desulfococcaceae bacterium]